MDSAFGVLYFLHIGAFLAVYLWFLRPDRHIADGAKKAWKSSLDSARKGRSRSEARRHARNSRRGDDLRYRLKGCFLLVVVAMGFAVLIYIELAVFTFISSLFN